jgi:alkaline phosphatase D
VVDLGIGGNWDRSLFSRRRFLGAAGGLAGLLAVGSLPAEKAVAAPRFSDYPFKLGVASDGPRHI